LQIGYTTRIDYFEPIFLVIVGVLIF
jgi:hypothetical protein